ncbi:MAG: DUF2842 domain-containing protein [Rhodobiaceae bacterium]|nr:DUF2842 domain-containing protein [Rhodobiaceae bacterium]
MPIRLKKLVGLVVILAFMGVYTLVIMSISVGRLMQAPHWVQVLYFLIAGMAWALPVMPIIRWMQRPPKSES